VAGDKEIRNTCSLNVKQHPEEQPMKTKDEYIESLASELKEWSAQIDHLAAKADNVSAHLKHQYIEELNELRTRHHAASEKIKELEESGSEAWVTVRETADKIWSELGSCVARVVSKFNDSKQI
jgi:hypothetical protein